MGLFFGRRNDEYEDEYREYDEYDDECEDEYNDEYDEDRDYYINLIASMTYRKRMSNSRYGHVYDTGIKGTMLYVNDNEREEFLEALAAHGPFAFILDENGVYNVACQDSPYFFFANLDQAPVFGNAIVDERRDVEKKGMELEYTIAATIDIMYDMGFDYDEIMAWIEGDPANYEDADWYFVNHYLYHSMYRHRDGTQMWPFSD